MAQIRPLTCTQLTKRLETKSTQCSELYYMLSPYMKNKQKITPKQISLLNDIACSMFDVLGLVSGIPDCEGDESHPALAHAYALKQAESLCRKYYRRPEDMDSAAESANEDDELILDRNVLQLGSTAAAKTTEDAGNKSESANEDGDLLQSRKIRPLGSTAAAKTTEDAKYKTDSDSDEDGKEAKRSKKTNNKRKGPNALRAPKAPKAPKTSETLAVAKTDEKSEEIPVSDEVWQAKLVNLMADMESNTNVTLVHEMIEMFTSEDGLFHADVLFEETNIHYFKRVADNIDYKHVDEGYKFFIDRVMANFPFSFDTQEIKNWVEEKYSRFHSHVYPGDTGKVDNATAVKDNTPPNVKAMLEFIEAVCDPSMIVDPKWESTYLKNPTGFFKMCASILRRHMELVQPDANRSPEVIFPLLHKVFNNIKNALKTFYIKNPQYAVLGGEYEIINYKIKHFHFQHVQNGFMHKVTGDYERRFMMCFDGVTSKYIRWCHTHHVNPCNFFCNSDRTFCLNNCACCTKHLRFFVHSTEEMEWLHTTPDNWEKILNGDGSLPSIGMGTRIPPLQSASV